MNRKRKIVWGVVAGLAVFTWLSGRNWLNWEDIRQRREIREELRLRRPEEFESHAQTWARYRLEATNGMMKSLTNDQVGLNRIIEIRFNDIGDDVSKWNAEAAVEFVNASGGVNRTNWYYRFAKWSMPSDGHVSAQVDGMKMYKQQQDAALGAR